MPLYTARLHKEDVARMSPSDIRLYLTLAFQQNVGGQVLRYTVKKLYEDSVANLNRYKMKLNPQISSSLTLINQLTSPTQIRSTSQTPSSLLFDTLLSFQVTEAPSTNMPLHFFASHYFTLQSFAKTHDTHALPYMLDYEIYTHVLLHAARISLTKVPSYYLPTSVLQVASNLHMDKGTVRKHLQRMDEMSVLTYLPGKSSEYGLLIIGEDKTEDILDALSEKRKINPNLFYLPKSIHYQPNDASFEELLGQEANESTQVKRKKKVEWSSQPTDV